MEELDIWLQAEVKVQARRPAVPKERRRLTANQVKLHIQEIAIQLRKALIPKEMFWFEKFIFKEYRKQFIADE